MAFQSQLHNSIWGQIRPFFAGFRFRRKSPTFNQVCQLAAKLNHRKNHRIWPPKRLMQLALVAKLEGFTLESGEYGLDSVTCSFTVFDFGCDRFCRRSGSEG